MLRALRVNPKLTLLDLVGTDALLWVGGATNPATGKPVLHKAARTVERQQDGAKFVVLRDMSGGGFDVLFPGSMTVRGPLPDLPVLIYMPDLPLTDRERAEGDAAAGRSIEE